MYICMYIQSSEEWNNNLKLSGVIGSEVELGG